ncbi:MAG TPA: L-threonylcarbamoyladenylate synthase [Thermoplasmata archaeon]|nr:L-threonylcarbamoyladenylate synthase [Thermoplasmata archaeon]
MTPGAALDRAVRALDLDELVVYPTDTLLGLGARADRPKAVARLVAAKGRSPSQPLSLALSSYAEFETWARLRPGARAEIRRRLPGPYTVLLPASPRALRSLSASVFGPRGTIGLRIPDHPTARTLAHRAGPIVATSANPHGARPARSIAEARRYFGERVSVYLEARPPPVGRPSQILDLTGRAARVVRRS